MAKGKIIWRNLFTSVIRSRGLEYYTNGNVTNIKDEGFNSYSATVEGTKDYDVWISFDKENNVESMSCSCPYALSGLACKHEAAVLFEMEAEGILDDIAEGKKEKEDPNDAFMKELDEMTPEETIRKLAEAAAREIVKSKTESLYSKNKNSIGAAKKNSNSLVKENLISESEIEESLKKMRETLVEDGPLPLESEEEEPEIEIESHNSLLKALISEDSLDNPSSEDDEDFVVDNYHYFDTKSILSKANIKPSILKQAEDIIYSETPPYIGTVNTGYLEIRGAVEPGGECTVFEADNSWNVDLTFVKDRIIRSYCSTCPYYRKYTNSSFSHDACVHEAVAILLLCHYLDDKDTTDDTNESASAFFHVANIKNNEMLSRKENGTGIFSEPLQLEMRLETPKNENRIFAAFYIGTKHMYKVKNLQKLLTGFVDKEIQTFGKDNDIYLSKDLLDDNSKKCLDFLRDEYSSYIQMKERYKSSEAIKYGYSTDIDDFKFPNSILLDKDRWDRFFEIESGNTIEYNDRSKGTAVKKNLFVNEGKFELKLNIKPITINNTVKKSFEGITIESENIRLFNGKEYIYQMTDKKLIRSDITHKKIAMALCAACDSNGIHMKVGRSKLNDFWHMILPELKEVADVEIYDEEYIEKYIVPEPEYHFYLDEQDSTIFGKGEVSYGGAKYSLGDWSPYKPEVVSEGFRKRSNEKNIYERFRKYLPKYSAGHDIFYADFSDEEMFDLLDHGLNELMDLGEVRVTDNFRNLKVRHTVPVRFGVSLNSGIMDLAVSSDDITEDELSEIMSAYKKKSRFYKLKNGDFLKLDDNPTVESLEEMMDELHISLKDFVNGHMEVPAYRALYLEHMLSQMEDVYANRDSHFRSLVRAFKSFEDSDYEVPENLNAKLRGYQEEGYEWLRTLDEWNFGGILADEMGLGKTLQTISCILAVHEGTSLVVCPASLVYNWGEEISKFAPSLKVALLSGTQSEREGMLSHIEDYDIAVTSYFLLKRDIDKYEDHEFRFVIVDEAQNVKNPATAIAKSVKLIKAKTRFALTGTPIENRVSELWSIFDFIMPGYLYDYQTFRNDMELPIMKNQDEEALNRLKRMVSPFILRRRKEDVLKDLPEKLEEVRFARMDSKQQRIYDAEVLNMKKKLNSESEEEFKKKKIEIFAELTKIREICCDPALLMPKYDGESAKTEMCMDLILSLIEGQHRMLLFSQFTSMFDILENRLIKAGIKYFKITGSTPKKTRLDLVKKFNEGDIPLFLISLKAGGTGLNLTGADVVIHFDPWWNLAAQNQATDRAHRIGQTKAVTVFKLIVKGTIEEKILALQESKKKLSEDILGGEGVGSSTIDKDELMALLG